MGRGLGQGSRQWALNGEHGAREGGALKPAAPAGFERGQKAGRSPQSTHQKPHTRIPGHSDHSDHSRTDMIVFRERVDERSMIGEAEV